MAKNNLSIKSIEKWHGTGVGLAVFGLAELVGAYLFASLAIPSAHTWQWALAVLFALGALHNALRLIEKTAYGFKAKTSKAERD